MSECEKIHNRLDGLAWKIYHSYIRFKMETHDAEALVMVSFTDEMQEFKKCFLELYNKSVLENYVWQYCSLDTYKLKYKQRLEDYLKTFPPDAAESDFIDDEKQLVKNKNHFSGFLYLYPKENNYKYTINVVLYDFDIDIEIRNKIKFSQEKKIQFLELKLGQFNGQSVKQSIQEPESPVPGENNSINDFPEIFAETGFQTFKMLDEKYKKDNKKLKTKYSNLYWFLEYKELLKCTKLEYIDFIHENYSVKLSKILPQTAKYEDIIQPLLMRYLADQQ